MDILFSNITVLTMDEDRPLLSNAYLGITGRKISWLSTEPPAETPDTVINGANKVVLPGFYNTHTHLAMSVFRGYADGYELDTWLKEHIWPAEAKLTREAVRAANTLGIAEAVAAGTVSFTDMYFHEPDLAELCLEIGVMGNLSNGAMSFDGSYNRENDRAWHEMVALVEHYHNRGGLVKADACIHAEYTSNPAVWETIGGFAKEKGLNMHLHLSETRAEHEGCVAKYGETPAAILNRHGLFDTRTTAAHCVFVTEEDMDILHQKDVTAVHDPGSNLKLASGVMNYGKMREHGVRLSMATDSASAINTTELFFELKLTAILHAGINNDSLLVPAHEALHMATAAGAYAQGRELESGCLKTGFDADLMVIDLDKPHLIPCHDVVSNVVYAARPSDVWLTMCKGKTLYKNGEWLTIDIERAKHDMLHVALPTIL